MWLFFANLFAPYLLVLIKKFSLGAVAMISVKRKLLQAITTPFSRHLPDDLFLTLSLKHAVDCHSYWKKNKKVDYGSFEWF